MSRGPLFDQANTAIGYSRPAFEVTEEMIERGAAALANADGAPAVLAERVLRAAAATGVVEDA